MSSSNHNDDEVTAQRGQSKGDKAKKRMLDFIDARDGWTKPKRIKKASLVNENDFESQLIDKDAQLNAQLCIRINLRMYSIACSQEGVFVTCAR